MSGEKYIEKEETSSGEIDVSPPLADYSKSRWQRAQPVIACGAGLFSDGMALPVKLRLAVALSERMR